MEKSLVCMREWKEVSSTSGAEIQRLKDELGSVKQERDALMAVARDAGKTLVEPPCEKTNNLHMRKQRRRSAAP